MFSLAVFRMRFLGVCGFLLARLSHKSGRKKNNTTPHGRLQRVIPIFSRFPGPKKGAAQNKREGRLYEGMV